jgi:hypothetical protein
MAEGLYNSFKEAYQGYKQKDPEMMAHGAASGATQVAQLVAATKVPEISGAESEIASTAQGALKVPKTIVRELVGVGEKDIAKSIEDSAAKVTEAQADYQQALKEHSEKVGDISKETAQKVNDAKAAHEQALAKHAQAVDKVIDTTAKKIEEANSQRIAASKGQSAAETRQAALVTKRGPVYQRMNELADTAQKNVQEVDSKVRKLEGAKWNALDRTVKNAPVDWAPVQQAVQDAEQNILKGSPENIAIFRNIMKEGQDPILSQASVFRGGGGARGADLKEVMGNMSPQARADFLQKIKAQGIEPPTSDTGVIDESASVPFDKARGYYTELNQKLHSASIPGDVRRALRTVQDSADGQISKTVAKAGGKDAVMFYRQLKSNWRDYMEAFYDKDSPIRKLKEGADPNDKLQPIVGDEGARAIQLFGKYKDIGADVSSLGRTRSLFKQIKSLSSTKAKPAEAVEKPRFPEPPGPQKTVAQPKLPKPPEAPTGKPMTAEEARRAKIEKGAQSYAHPPSRWELMFPPLLAYRLAIKKLLQSHGVQDWLAK